jgi:drug/metabolite transporter, DME family
VVTTRWARKHRTAAQSDPKSALKRNRQTAGAAALVILAAVLFGTTGTARALGPGTASPLAVGALRILVGGLLLTALAIVRRAPLARCWDPEVRRATVIAALSVASYQPCFFAAVKLSGVALGTLVAIGSAPVFAGLLEIMLGERPAGSWVVATALAVGGCAVLLAPSGSTVQPLGPLLAVGAGGSYAAFSVASRRLVLHVHSPDAAMAVVFAAGAVLLLPLLAAQDLSWLASARGVAVVAWLGLAATAAAYWLFARGLVHLSAATATTLDLAEPLTATLLGVLVLGERPGLQALIGAASIAAGLLLLTLVPQRRTETR